MDTTDPQYRTPSPVLIRIGQTVETELDRLFEKIDSCALAGGVSNAEATQFLTQEYGDLGDWYATWADSGEESVGGGEPK